MSDVMNLSEKTKVKVKVCSFMNTVQLKGGVTYKNTYHQHPTSGTEVEIDQEDLDFIDFANEIQEEAQRIYTEALAKN